MSDATIGEVGARVGLKIPTVRYYESIGLLPPPPRTQGHRRTYNATAIGRLGFIKQARDLGFSIATIRSLLLLAAQPEQPCDDANTIVAKHLAEVDRKIARLISLRNELASIGKACAGGQVAQCGVIRSLGDISRDD